MRIKVLFFIVFTLLNCKSTFAIELELWEFDKKMDALEELGDFPSNSPEAQFLSTLKQLDQQLEKYGNSPELIQQSLTLLETTDFLEEDFPRQTELKFPENFLVGSNLSVSDLANASYFLNSLQDNQLRKLKGIEDLSLADGNLSNINTKVIESIALNPSELINQLEAMPKLDLVALSAGIDGASSTISKTTETVSSNIENATSSLSDAVASSSNQLSQAASQIQSATQTLSHAAGAAMAAASYSLDQAASAIANTISAGVAVDLDSASQGLGYDNFAAAVDAYNSQYGTNYTVETAKDALGQ